MIYIHIKTMFYGSLGTSQPLGGGIYHVREEKDKKKGHSFE